MSTMHSILEAMAPKAREALLAHSHPVTFPAGTRIFNERRQAEKFWIIQCGTVDLDTHVPGHKNVVEDSAVGRSVSTAVAAVIADRLDSARTRLLDLFAPHGSGTPLA
ncbi:cyclic nucleotide-binding domain-containing protein [Streptomyces venezuelae]|uniref:cyclic nucleotide-binding domain-containing protein n=1 Tax=Streptomyces venezuelae TaxID=54571 RepID=UPI0033207BE6